MSANSSRGLMRCALAFTMTLFMLSAQAQSKDVGLLWQAEAPSGKISYLFGTMHTDDPRANDFSPATLDALKQSQAFMMETLPANDPMIFLMQNDTLDKHLSEKEMDKVFELADFHSMHHDAANTMKPWLLAIIFDLPKPQSPFTQDAQLFSAAQSQEKEVLGLEDISEHFGVLDSFTLDEQLTMLRAVLKRSPEEKERDYEALLNAYLAGDTAKISKIDEDITGGMLPKAIWDKMRVKLLDERNVVMAERIANQANESSVFVAVGASHLGGKGGLLERLRGAGYKVSAVK